MQLSQFLQMLRVDYRLSHSEISLIIDASNYYYISNFYDYTSDIDLEFKIPLPVTNDYAYLTVKSISIKKIEETYDFHVPETSSFIANGIVNHNSGKSALVAMCSSYILHKQLKLQKPNEVYGLLPANVLHGTFVALTYKQAAETLWEPFMAYITDSPWFCVDGNTEISLADNKSNKIKDLVPGKDLIKTSKSPGRKLNHIFDNSIQDCLTLTLESGHKLIATGQHKVKVFDSISNSLVWKMISELTLDDYVVVD